RRAVAVERRSEAERRLDALLAERTRAEDELTDAAGTRESANAALYRLRSAAERLALRRESAEALVESLEAWATAPATPPRNDVLDLARGRLAALEHALAEREGLPPAARALAEEGEQLALSLLDVEPGAERAVAASLRHRAAALVAPDAARALALVEQAQAAGLGSLVVLVDADPQRL